MKRTASTLALALTFVALYAGAVAHAEAQPRLTPLSSGSGPELPAPWRIVTLPKIPRHTRYAVGESDGRRAVHAEADASYANVVHPVNADIARAPILRFAWRVDQFPAGSDLTSKAGDDLAAKVCVLFDVPLDRLSFVERTKVQLGRRLFDPQLPAATLCYVWDRTLPAGRWLDNAYTNRVRMLVLRSGANGDQGRWFDERRDLRADFAQAFPAEAAAGTPAVAAVAFATDADNTKSQASAWFGDLALVAE
ncbi:MAG: DUF3047 domain-containing protein [Burkholderiaceae bacterium]